MNILVLFETGAKEGFNLANRARSKVDRRARHRYEMSEADAYALEEALRQKEKHGGKS